MWMDAIFVRPLSETPDTISPQPRLFLGYLRAAEVAPKRAATGRPVSYFKLSTPTAVNRVKQVTH